MVAPPDRAGETARPPAQMRQTFRFCARSSGSHRVVPGLPATPPLGIQKTVAPILIGTSGFSYPHWRHGVFYPEHWPASRELEFYAGAFATVELNNPFYRLPSTAAFARWRQVTPPNFCFSVKASRYITHVKRLHAAAPALRLFLARAGRLGPKLGPVLFQFPAAWRLNLERLEEFLPRLPRQRQFAFEFRHPSWFVPAVADRLRNYGAAWCHAVHPDLPPPLEVVTAPFTYIRFHAGRGEGGNFTAAELRPWARRIAGYARAGVAVYAYFNNDWRGFALADARQLLAFAPPASSLRRSAGAVPSRIRRHLP